MYNFSQVNLLFLACAVVCVYLSVPTVAASSHCGYHYLQHYARTIFNATHYTRYYRLKLGYCSPWGVISNFLFFVISMNAFVLTTIKEELVVHELIRSTVFKGHCEIES